MKQLLAKFWAWFVPWIGNESTIVAHALGAALVAGVGVIVTDILNHDPINWNAVLTTAVVTFLGWFGVNVAGVSAVRSKYAIRFGVRKPLGAIITPRDDPRDIDFASFKLPPTPTGFVGTKRKPTGMLGNNTIGDCVIAMMLHAIILADTTAKFTTKIAIAYYSRITGYVPGKPSTDRGANPISAIKWWAKNGIIDANGDKHELIGWATIKVGNFDALRAAINLKGVFVAVSLNLPYSAQNQFPSRKWTVVPGSPDEGGHEVLAYNDDGIWTGLGTWGAGVGASRGFMTTFSALWVVLITDGADPDVISQELAALAAIQKVK